MLLKRISSILNLLERTPVLESYARSIYDMFEYNKTSYNLLTRICMSVLKSFKSIGVSYQTRAENSIRSKIQLAYKFIHDLERLTPSTVRVISSHLMSIFYDLWLALKLRKVSI